MDPKPNQQDRDQELPGDTNSADIVGPTGEQMPQQSHDGQKADDRDSRSSNTDEDRKPVRTSKS